MFPQGILTWTQILFLKGSHLFSRERYHIDLQDCRLSHSFISLWNGICSNGTTGNSAVCLSSPTHLGTRRQMLGRWLDTRIFKISDKVRSLPGKLRLQWQHVVFDTLLVRAEAFTLRFHKTAHHSPDKEAPEISPPCLSPPSPPQGAFDAPHPFCQKLQRGE